MILLWWSTCSPGWAASMPSRASATTSAGSLISFFMGLPLSFRSGFQVGALLVGPTPSDRGGHRVGEVHAGTGALLVGRRAGQDAVGQRGQGTREQLGGQVDRELAPLHRTTGDLLDQHRPEGAGRVDRGAGR